MSFDRPSLNVSNIVLMMFLYVLYLFELSALFESSANVPFLNHTMKLSLYVLLY